MTPPELTRRSLLQATGLSAFAVAANSDAGAAPVAESNPGRIPLIHTTDLYHPPGDPDDHVDLATAFALPEFDIRAVILDHNHPNGHGYPADPGLVPVAQLCYITGRAAPVAVGPFVPLSRPDDTAADRPLKEQAGINLILRVLEESAAPVVISVMGSARAVMAAYNRDPELVRKKTRAVAVNAGSTGAFMEWNVQLDPHAYVQLFRSGLPVHWYPCATDTSPCELAERNTYFYATHRELFNGLPRPLCAWFCHSYCGNLRGDIIRALDEQGIGAVWEHVLAGGRNLWSTASLVLAAGRVLAKTNEGWRFMGAEDAPADAPRQLLGLTPAVVEVADDGKTTWRDAGESAKVRMFRRAAGPEHTAAMTEALNALLRSMPVA